MQVSPEILGQALLETPGGIVQCWESVGDPPPPCCWQISVAMRGEGTGLYSWLAALWGDATHCWSDFSLWLVYPRSDKGVHKSQALENGQV